MVALKDVKVGPIFPPYQLGDFQRCPKLWDYKRRWVSGGMENNTALLVGTAIALGLEKLYLGESPGRAQDAALECARSQYPEEGDRSLETVLTLVKRGFKHGALSNLGLKEILGVERFYGRIRPDLVGRSADNSLVVVDHKVKLKLDDQYKEKELLQYDTSNQFFHYAWGVGQEYGEPVSTVYAHLIVLAPRVYTEMHPVRIDQEHLAMWLESAARDWRDMDAARETGITRGRFGSCVDKYGPCEFYDACHVLYGDESKFESLYGRKPERRY